MARDSVSARWKSARAILTACVVAASAALLTFGAPSEAAAQTRALKIYNLHTHERATIVFKRNGRYDKAGLKKLNYILRDWRRNEPTNMDPRLFDLIWEVYQKTGATDYINVVCGYRSPGTNNMLRSRSKGVAEKSQHIQGKAMDFFIPGVKLSKLRETGMKFQVGGVGYYPRSGSPFVHMDVGSVRSWPRMSRAELARLFPDGKTLHRPAEGGQMPGFNQAMADYKKRVGKNAILVAGGGSDNTDTDTGGKGKSLLATLFGGDENEEAIVEADIADAKARKPAAEPKVIEDNQDAVVMAAAEPEKLIKAPVPMNRPAFKDAVETPAIETALVSPERNAAEEAMLAAMAATQPAEDDGFADLSKVAVPVPTILGERKQAGDAEDPVLTAALDAGTEGLDTVPVPDKRPAEEAALLAAASIDDVAEPALTNDEVAALAAEASAGTPVNDTTDEDEADADLADSLDVAAEDAQPVEMAALDAQPQVLTRSVNLAVGDQQAEPVARKGARPKLKDAEAAAVKAEKATPRLTGNMIAKWALTTGRVATLAKPVKAPRFVSPTLRAQPTAVYAEGFTQEAAQIDPGRFSGTAVNFPAVRKFNTETN